MTVAQAIRRTGIGSESCQTGQDPVWRDSRSEAWCIWREANDSCEPDGAIRSETPQLEDEGCFCTMDTAEDLFLQNHNTVVTQGRSQSRRSIPREPGG